jgi:hypothetical protein
VRPNTQSPASLIATSYTRQLPRGAHRGSGILPDIDLDQKKHRMALYFVRNVSLGRHEITPI